MELSLFVGLAIALGTLFAIANRELNGLQVLFALKSLSFGARKTELDLAHTFFNSPSSRTIERLLDHRVENVLTPFFPNFFFFSSQISFA